MQCPVCQKQIKLQRYIDSDNLSYPFPYRAWRGNQWSSQLTIQCEETILLDNKQSLRHFYKDYWSGDSCGVWIIIYPYRIRQLRTMTQIQRYRVEAEKQKLIADGHGIINSSLGNWYSSPSVSDWELIVEVPKLTNEEAIQKCEAFKKYNVRVF